MARAVHHAARLVTALCVDSAGRPAAVRRGYSAAAALRKAEEKMVATAKGKKTGGAGLAEPPPKPAAGSSSWVPDPVTGYYRPANSMAPDVDFGRRAAAEPALQEAPPLRQAAAAP